MGGGVEKVSSLSSPHHPEHTHTHTPRHAPRSPTPPLQLSLPHPANTFWVAMHTGDDPSLTHSIDLINPCSVSFSSSLCASASVSLSFFSFCISLSYSLFTLLASCPFGSLSFSVFLPLSLFSFQTLHTLPHPCRRLNSLVIVCLSSLWACNPRILSKLLFSGELIAMGSSLRFSGAVFC